MTRKRWWENLEKENNYNADLTQIQKGMFKWEGKKERHRCMEREQDKYSHELVKDINRKKTRFGTSRRCRKVSRKRIGQGL